MQGFKKRLKKDLKFIQNIYIKIIGAIGISLFITFSAPFISYVFFANEEQSFIFLAVTSFVFLYLMDAWLYGEEELKDDSV